MGYIPGLGGPYYHDASACLLDPDGRIVAFGLGDGTSCAGKLMGLAAYGTPRSDIDFMRIEDGGRYLIDLGRFGMPPAEDARDQHADWTYYYRQRQAFFAAIDALGVPRHVLASIQALLERCLLGLARMALRETGLDTLCIAGGVGLNCTANGRIARESGAGRIFVQPVAGDAGCAMGAALHCAHRKGRLRVPGMRMADTALGPAFDDDAIRRTIEALNLRAVRRSDDAPSEAAERLAAGQVRLDAGSRRGRPARSGGGASLPIRATARRDRVNRGVKRREMWRPFAPSMLAGAAKRYLEADLPSEFMIVANTATVHVDNSLRPQIVTPEINPPYAALLSAFGALTGVPAVLNTSFNLDNEPIVCTPLDAIRTFYSSGLDTLVLGSYLIEKR